jgi:hypothetical protein
LNIYIFLLNIEKENEIQFYEQFLFLRDHVIFSYKAKIYY